MRFDQFRLSGFVAALCCAFAAAVGAWRRRRPTRWSSAWRRKSCTIIKSDPKVQAGDQARIREVVETKLLPYFDFERITALAMGRNWRQATPEQQKQLVDQFRALLVRTYSGALAQYRTRRWTTSRCARDANATDVTVRTEVVRQGQAPVPDRLRHDQAPSGWKVYDVIVGGVSLVTNYRDEFNEQIKNGGVDGLIKTLQAKNRERRRSERRTARCRPAAPLPRPAIAGRSAAR